MCVGLSWGHAVMVGPIQLLVMELGQVELAVVDVDECSCCPLTAQQVDCE